MKIGIITFHRAHNYGAILQCFALQSVLKSLGHNVCILDYKQSYIESHYKIFSFTELLRCCKSPWIFLHYLRTIKYRKIRNNIFPHFANHYLNIEHFDGKKLPKEIDVVFIGSDQLWSKSCLNDFDPIYMGQFVHNKNQIIATYALSSDVKSIKELTSKHKQMISDNFNALSFREKKISELLKTIIGRDSLVCLDPVLLTTIKAWEPIIDDKWSKKKFVLLYQVHAVNGDFDNALIFAKKIANKFGCEIIDLTDVTYSPNDFVSLFYYAKFVVTTSFHGTIFSVIFHKLFFTLSVNKIIDERAYNILSQLNLLDRMVSINDPTPTYEINYEDVDSRLKELQIDSIKYITSLLK